MVECQFQRSQHRLYQSHGVKYLVAKVLVWDPSSTRPATPGLPVKVTPLAVRNAATTRTPCEHSSAHAARSPRDDIAMTLGLTRQVLG